MFHGFFFTNENPRKFVEKQKMIFFYIFHVYLDNSKRTITQGTSAPEDFLPRGNFWPRKFSPRRLLSKKDPLCQGDLFVQEDVYLFGTIVQRHLCNKGHPMAKYVVWSRSADKTEIRHLVIVLREILTCKLKSSYWNFLLLRTCLYFSQPIQSHVQLRTKGILCCFILLQWPIRRQ